MNLNKENRQKALSEIIKSQKIGKQGDLLKAMEAIGISATQASLSRDIAELGVLKENGHYVLHPASFYQGGILQIISIQPAGPNLLVVKTAAGAASAVSSGIDDAKIDDVVGTIAGDDTIFVAISSPRKASLIKKEIVKKFRPTLNH